jgi:hypothetical protein
MNFLTYCYGPFSVEKNVFCKNFAKENKNYNLIDTLKIRKKILGSFETSDPKKELELNNLIVGSCLSLLLNNKDVLVNGLFLNKKSRISLVSRMKENIISPLKITSIAFSTNNLSELYENNKKDKIFKDLTFDNLRAQDSIFSKASTAEEGDLLINKIEKSLNDEIEIDTKLWQEDRIIHCNNLKKVSEYINHANSFN